MAVRADDHQTGCEEKEREREREGVVLKIVGFWSGVVTSILAQVKLSVLNSEH